MKRRATEEVCKSKREILSKQEDEERIVKSVRTKNGEASRALKGSVFKKPPNLCEGAA